MVRCVVSSTESIQLFIEKQAFSLSYDLAPPAPLPPFRVSKLSLFLSLPACCRSCLLRRRGWGCWGGAKSYDAEKALASIYHSILSEVVQVVNSSRSFEYNFDNVINIKLLVRLKIQKLGYIRGGGFC